jgi:hypothetical protein
MQTEGLFVVEGFYVTESEGSRSRMSGGWMSQPKPLAYKSRRVAQSESVGSSWDNCIDVGIDGDTLSDPYGEYSLRIKWLLGQYEKSPNSGWLARPPLSNNCQK